MYVSLETSVHRFNLRPITAVKMFKYSQCIPPGPCFSDHLLHQCWTPFWEILATDLITMLEIKYFYYSFLANGQSRHAAKEAGTSHHGLFIGRNKIQFLCLPTECSSKPFLKSMRFLHYSCLPIGGRHTEMSKWKALRGRCWTIAYL